MDEKEGKTYTATYLAHFGDQRYQFIDHMPSYDKDLRKEDHVSLEDKFLVQRPTYAELEDMDKYSHPCWCHPELIYADDLRGNEVWLHKPPQ